MRRSSSHFPWISAGHCFQLERQKQQISKLSANKKKSIYENHCFPLNFIND